MGTWVGWRGLVPALAIAVAVVIWAAASTPVRAGPFQEALVTPVPVPVTIPVGVPGLTSGVAGLDAGSGHTCAVLASGAVQCWGSNIYGQLGNGTTETSAAIVNVSGISTDALAVSAGGVHSCAVLNTFGTPSPASAGAKCWGDNLYGQLGNGTTVDSLVPVAVGNLTGAVQSIASGGTETGSHTCTLTSTGVYCSGSNDVGQLGNGTFSAAPIPVPAQVAGLTGSQSAIVAGDTHTCALSATGQLKCWGSGSDGRLGNASTANANAPVDVDWSAADNATPASVSAGSSHNCAVTTTGEAACWGLNGNGQLGDNSIVNSSMPIPVVDPPDPTGRLTGVTGIAAGNTHSCAVLSTGAVKCWGQNAFGQLGNGSTLSSLVPVPVTGITTATKVTAGSGYSCALTAEGAVYCWGNIYPPTAPTQPTQLRIFLPIVAR